MSRKDQIKDLESQQAKDRYSPVAKPQIIQPTKKIYLPNLKPIEKICYVCWLSKAITQVELAGCLNRSERAIRDIISRAKRKLQEAETI